MKKKNTILITALLTFGIIGTLYASNNRSSQIKKLYGDQCKITQHCAEMVYVDCGAAVDGPAYYLNQSNEVIGTSGGLCMNECSGAPEQWTQCMKTLQN